MTTQITKEQILEQLEKRNADLRQNAEYNAQRLIASIVEQRKYIQLANEKIKSLRKELNELTIEEISAEEIFGE